MQECMANLKGIGLVGGHVAHNPDHAKLTGAHNAVHLQVTVLYLGLGNQALLGAVMLCHTLLQQGLQGCSQNCLCYLPWQGHYLQQSVTMSTNTDFEGDTNNRY